MNCVDVSENTEMVNLYLLEIENLGLETCSSSISAFSLIQPDLFCRMFVILELRFAHLTFVAKGAPELLLRTFKLTKKQQPFSAQQSRLLLR
jgi:hypothetical protein